MLQDALLVLLLLCTLSGIRVHCTTKHSDTYCSALAYIFYTIPHTTEVNIQPPIAEANLLLQSHTTFLLLHPHRSRSSSSKNQARNTLTCCVQLLGGLHWRHHVHSLSSGSHSSPLSAYPTHCGTQAGFPLHLGRWTDATFVRIYVHAHTDP